MSKAILVVSFGTAYAETRKKTIEAIEQDLAAAFPERKRYTACTSGMIQGKLKKLGEATRDTLTEALEKMERGEEATVEAAAVKCLSGDAAVFCATEALQIFGGNGYCEGFPAEKLLRDARAFQIVEGTNEVQRQLIGGKLLK